MTKITKITELTEGEYTAAVAKLDRVYRHDVNELTSMIEAVRDDQMLHETEGGKCVSDCVGCLTGKIADAVTRVVNDS